VIPRDPAAVLEDQDADDLALERQEERESDLWTPARLRALIDSLGAEPDEVCGSLLKASCRGIRGAYDHCPIAVWLEKQGAPLPVVQALSVTVCCDDGTQVSAYTSEAAKQFVELFDAGNYPELEVDS
jgi:hypothetical protein